ncbi:amino acid transporter [Enterococcus florum]|uniref:Amino acid transporter n=1 Tax=Enterococcus florum TaxID=2480627 RepID=A0A4P5P646_9ENTE|nr:APC family permease [Enterococcus florum]GCF93190.1 amino acid transporter [Enterococcus florum]
MEEKKVSLVKSILFTICSVLVLDSFVASSAIGVSSITIWLITTVLFFLPYGLVTAELGSNYPGDGGIYLWIKRAFGDKVGVLNGWFYWVNVAFWMPAVFVAFSSWFSYAFMPNASPIFLAGLALIMCWLIVYIGIRGVDLSVTVTNIAAIFKVAVLLIFGLMGILYAVKHGSANDFSAASFIPTPGNTVRYISVIIYNLLGFELIGSIGNQIENPGKTIPKMTVVAGIAISALYIFGTYGVLVAVPANQIDTVDGFYYALLELCRVFGELQMPVFYIIILVAMSTLISNMVSWTLGANEVFIAARLDQRNRFLKHRSKKYGTPDGLYYFMGIVATFLIIINYATTGDANAIFWTIFSFSVIILMIPYLFMFPAAVILRKKDAEMSRIYQVPGGKTGLMICVILGEACLLLSILFMFITADSAFVIGTYVVGTLITFLLGIWLYRSKEQIPEDREQQLSDKI